ncbi:MAG: hypothetical protein IOMNBAOH_01480 [Rhodocyclaceae bacterium]|nr:hypothetical protein [Rhodocyclaceae bacterium]
MNDTNEQDDQDRIALRRRLLKAAAGAAPMVFTLPVGAQVAASSANQCVAKDAAKVTATTPPRYTTTATNPTTDGWVRFKAEVVMVKFNSSGAQNIKAWLVKGKTYAAENKTVNSTTYTIGALIAPTQYGYVSLSPQQYANLLVFDDGSNPLGFYKIYPETKTSSQTALTGSCWNSVHPGNPLGPGNIFPG